MHGNPVRLNDPSGHIPIIDNDKDGNSIVNYVEYRDNLAQWNYPEQYLLSNSTFPVKNADNSSVTSLFGRYNTIASLNNQGTELEVTEWIEKYGLHMGVDISGTSSNQITAFYSGIVVMIMNSDTNGGNKIVIMHEIGNRKYFSVYFHLASINVSLGQNVMGGETIGIMGDTAANTIHLHFEVRTELGFPFNESGGYNNITNLYPYWACSKTTFDNNWVDISRLFGGPSSDIPVAWR